jgi:hypothetical protein
MKIGDIVKFIGTNSRRTDYLADLEADWSDHMLTESEYSMRVRILEGFPCVITETEESCGEVLYGLLPIDDKTGKPYFMEGNDLAPHHFKP